MTTIKKIISFMKDDLDFAEYFMISFSVFALYMSFFYTQTI